MKRYFLNGTQIADEPNGDIITSIERDRELGSFLVKNDAQLKWHGDGYAYIQSIIEDTGFCGEMICEITDDCSGSEVNIFTGKIFILTIIKSENCVITAPLVDNSWQARINKNKSIEIYIDTVKSKNNIDIEAAKVNRVTMFSPATGTALANYRSLYRVYDVFKNMVAFMSDDEVDFDSSLFGIGGEFEGLSVGLGLELAFPSGNNPVKESFDKFFKELNKKLKLTFYVDATGVKPVLRIERADDLFLTSVIKNLANVAEVKIRVDSDKLYAIVSVGATEIQDVASGPGILFPEQNDYITYKEEDYTLLEQCNIDKRLDLVSQYITSSNLIGELVMTPVIKNEDVIHFVDCGVVTDVTTHYTSNAKQGDPFGSGPPFFYNSSLTNDQVLERWKRSFAADSLAVYQGTGNNRFKAANTAIVPYIVGTTSDDPFRFDNDYTSPNFDGDTACGLLTGNYGNATAQCTAVADADSFYTCPADGVYTFYCQFLTRSFPNANTITMYFRRLNAANVVLQDFASPSQTIGPTPAPGFQLVSHQASFYCDQTNRVRVMLLFSPNGFSIFPGSNQTYFECTSAPQSRSITLDLNKNNAPIILSEFEYPIKSTDFYNILADPFKKISFSYPNDKFASGWIQTIKFNHTTQIANLTLLGTSEMLK